MLGECGRQVSQTGNKQGKTKNVEAEGNFERKHARRTSSGIIVAIVS